MCFKPRAQAAKGFPTLPSKRVSACLRLGRTAGTGGRMVYQKGSLIFLILRLLNTTIMYNIPKNMLKNCPHIFLEGLKSKTALGWIFLKSY